ncbi:sugar ABC transporter permease [Fodinisporobacter ferrooxydans]|uniref:Sugar ABC transporter permease n=1 Tax=Fodinisporobacter ferrooxydans TaxID=2901836 RepID=A0ABY4CQX7_9BACL|nr:sugar ABC transporter permease [Alicyclobacillaceae bacterium MYW30-H2]
MNGAQGIRVSSMSYRLQKNLLGWLFVLPTFGFLSVFVIASICYVLYLSFFQWNLISPHPTFVGLKNYIDMVKDRDFQKAVIRTFFYMLGTTGITLPLALIFALLLNKPVRGIALLRGMIFVPYVIPAVSAAIAWGWLLEPHFGLVNYVLHLFGFSGYTWLSHPKSALISLIFIYVWQFSGYFTMLFLSGLQSIPESLYEAVKVDGGSWWAQFRHVTCPMLSPTLFFTVTMSIIFSVQSFDQIFVLTNGGPADSTTTIVFYLFKQGFQFFHIGNAAAISILMLMFLFLVTYLQFRGSEKWVHHQM